MACDLAEALDVAKSDGSLRICSRMREQGGDIVGINEIVLLLVVPKRTLVPHHQPTNIPSPAEPRGLDNHLETRILEQGPAYRGRLLIRSVYRNEHVEIAMSLPLQTSQRFGNVIHAAIGWYAHADIFAHAG